MLCYLEVGLRQELDGAQAEQLKSGPCEQMCVCGHLFSPVWLSVTPWTQFTRLLCWWDSPGRLLEWAAIFLLQGIFHTQGLNPGLLCLLHWQADSLPLTPLGKPLSMTGIH